MTPNPSEKAEVIPAFSNLNKLRAQLAEKFLKALEEERLPWQQPWKNLSIRYGTQQNAVSGRRYRGVNAAWLWTTAMDRGYEDPRWCTFNQARDQGWKIRKGEHGVPIEFWSMYDPVAKKKISREAYDRIVSADPDKAAEYSIISQFFTVFNGQQIDGIPPLPQNRIEPEYQNTLMQKFTDGYLENAKLELKLGGDRAYYHTENDYIQMPPKAQFFSEAEYYQTLVHECAHSTGHTSRMNRHFEDENGKEDYAKEELRAEIASNFVLSDCALMPDSTMQNSKAYIQNWAEAIKKDPGVLFKAIIDADKIADYISEKGGLQPLLGSSYETAVTPEIDDFSIQVDKFLRGELSAENALLVCNTPDVFIEVGMQPLPMLLTQRHLGNILHPKGEENMHWHGLSIEQVKNLPNQLKQPAMVVKSWTNVNSVIAVTNQLDSDRLPIVVSITPNGTGTYELEEISSNFITSVYGRNRFASVDQSGQLDKLSFMGLALENNAILHINKKMSQVLFENLGLQLPEPLKSLDSVNIISQTPQNGNTAEVQILNDSEKSAPKNHEFSAQSRGVPAPQNSLPSLDEIKSVSILRVAGDMGYTPVKKGNRLYSLKEHDSLMLYPETNTYCRFFDGKGGSTIDFVANMGALTQGDAIRYLRNQYTNAPRSVKYSDTPRHGSEPEAYEPQPMPYQPKHSPPPPAEEPKAFALPERAAGKYGRLYAYLTRARCIDPAVVRDCIHRKLIYEEKEHHNSVFVGYDAAGEAAFATMRGTLSDSHFKCDIAGSKQDIGFFVDNKSEKLYVTEAAIDALSIMSLCKANYKNASYLSTCGTQKDAAVYARLEQHPEITRVCLANDNDEPGRKTNERIKNTLAQRFPHIAVSVIVPIGKDFNEQLVNKSRESAKSKDPHHRQEQEVE